MAATISTKRFLKSRSPPFSASRIEGVMSTAQISFMPLFRRLDRIATELHRLIDRTLDGYRPERHYMRGPGPKWHAKHRAGEAFRQPPYAALGWPPVREATTVSGAP